MADQNQNPNQQQGGQRQAGAQQQGDDQPKIKVEVRSATAAGFRRMGRHFTSAPQEIEVTEQEYEQQLKNEGQLIVRRLDGSERSAGAQQGGDSGGQQGRQSGQQQGGQQGGGSQTSGAGRPDTSQALGAPTGGTGGHTPGASTLAEGKPVGDEPGAKRNK